MSAWMLLCYLITLCQVKRLLSAKWDERLTMLSELKRRHFHIWLKFGWEVIFLCSRMGIFVIDRGPEIFTACYIFFTMASLAHSRPRTLIQFRNHFSQTVGLFGRVITSSQGRHLNTGQHKDRINAYTHQTFISWVGFETTIPASERAKTVHALDRAVTVTG
jgi:hypothetical protein